MLINTFDVRLLMSSLSGDSTNEDKFMLIMGVNVVIDTDLGLGSLVDPYTLIHQRRVSMLAQHISHQMDVPSSVVLNVGLAGTIHDIGKKVIPIEILEKLGY